jgi:hypothetical protein
MDRMIEAATILPLNLTFLLQRFVCLQPLPATNVPFSPPASNLSVASQDQIRLYSLTWRFAPLFQTRSISVRVSENANYIAFQNPFTSTPPPT